MADDWLKRPNGTRKRISEMTPEERMRVWKLAAENPSGGFFIVRCDAELKLTPGLR